MTRWLTLTLACDDPRCHALFHGTVGEAIEAVRERASNDGWDTATGPDEPDRCPEHRVRPDLRLVPTP